MGSTAPGTIAEISFTVDGYPPAKGEALSMLGAGHSHASRVLELLRVARTAALRLDCTGFGSSPIGLELTLTCERDRVRGDATNYLGGIADVLEDKAHRGSLAHLGDLAVFGLYANDRQIEEIRYRWETAAQPSYSVRLWALESR